MSKNTPELRFPSFREDWIKDSLNKITTVNPKTKELPDIFIYIDLESVKSGILEKENIIYKDEAPSRAQRLLHKDDILYQTVRPYQKNNFYFNIKNTLPYVASTGYAQLRSKINSKYLYHLLHTNRFNKDVLNACTGTSYPAINSTDLSNINVNYTANLNEQNKIASFLSFIDYKLNILAKKKDLMLQYKKGIMQKLFSQEIRFKDNNNDYPDWSNFDFGSLITHIGGTSLEKEVSLIGQYKFISIGNYSPSGTYIDNGQRINSSVKSESKKLNKNDLVMILNDKTHSGRIIGSTILIDRDNTYVYNQRSERIICKDTLNPNFAYHYLNSDYFRNEVFKRSQGGTQIYINFPEVEKIKVKVPCIQEQVKIASYLSRINSKIQSLSEEYKILLNFKMGLLQKMFV